MTTSSQATARKRSIFASDIRRLGGSVTVVPGHDRVDGTGFYRLSYISGGGDLAWTSPRIEDEETARAIARTFADFLNARAHL